MKDTGVKETTETENWVLGATDSVVYMFFSTRLNDWHSVVGL